MTRFQALQKSAEGATQELAEWTVRRTTKPYTPLKLPKPSLASKTGPKIVPWHWKRSNRTGNTSAANGLNLPYNYLIGEGDLDSSGGHTAAFEKGLYDRLQNDA